MTQPLLSKALELEYQLSTLNDVEGQQKLDLVIPSCDFLCGEVA